MTRSKRGQSEMGGRVMYAVLIVLVLSVAMYAFTTTTSKGAKTFLGIKLPWAPDEDEIKTVNSLAAEVTSLTKSKERFVQSSVKYEIKADEEILVGFDTHGWDDDFPVETCLVDEIIRRPKQCDGRACLCKFKDTTFNDFKASNVISCVKYEGTVVFLGEPGSMDPNNYNEGVPKSASDALVQDYEYLVLYGECGPALPHNKFYIDIFKTDELLGETTYIYISLFHSDSEENRKKLYESKTKPK